MLFKRDAEGESTDTWATADLNGWAKAELGKDWGNFDGIGWFATEIDATAAEGEYAASFGNVDDEMWLYADGKLVGSHAGASKPFKLTFDVEKTEGKIRLAVKVKDNGGNGGILSKVVVERPKAVGRQEALNIGLANQALVRHADALKDFHDWMRGMKEDDPNRDAAIRCQNRIYALDGNLERLEGNRPIKPAADYYRLLGSAYEAKNQLDKAAEAFQKGVEADPADRPELQAALVAQAQYHERRNDWRQAHNAYVALIDLMKGTPAEGRFKGYLVYITNDRWRNVGRARELLTQYAAEYPQSGYWARALADHLYDNAPQDFANALAAYQKWFMMNDGLVPDHAGSRIWDCLVRVQNYNAAQTFCTMWLNRFKDHPYRSEMLYRQAETKRILGQENSQARDEALAAFKQLQKDYPRTEAASNAIRRVMETYSLQETLAMFDQWEKDNPGHPYNADFLWQFGQRMEQHKDFGLDKALDLYKRIWKDYRWKWAENLYAYDRIANQLWAQRKFDEAFALYAEAIATFQGNNDGRATAAWWRYALKYGNFVPFTVETDSTHDQFAAARLNDDYTDGQNGNPNGSWASQDSDKEHWIDCVMAQPQEIRKIMVWWAGADHLPQGFKVQYFDGNKYLDVPGMADFRPAKELAESWTIKPLKTNKIRFLQKASGGGKNRPGVMLGAEVRLYRHVNDELWADLEKHYRNMMGKFWHQQEHWAAGLSLCSYLGWRGQFLEADIQLQKLLYALPANHPHFWDQASQDAKTRMDQGRFGEAAAIFRTLLGRNKAMDQARRLDAERLLGQALSKSGEDYAAIDPNLPEAGLLWGSVFARNGEYDLAWERYQQNRPLFYDHQHKLSFEFIRLIVRNLLLEKETSEAIKVCRFFLIKRKDDKHVTNSERAQIQLLVGDAYFREERYEVARDEYNTVLTLPEYKDLPDRVEARFKVGQTLMAQKIYAKAEEIFEELTGHPEVDTMARAHLMLGILYHAQGENKRAEEKFKEVLAMMPNNETADEIIYRLGTVYQERRKYKEALDALRLIGAWSGESKRVVEPGRSLRIRLSDRDLTIARGSAEVPVIVTTSGGDSERALLEKSEVGRGLFVAEVETKLGEPTPNDRKLQVMGNDTITYAYEEKWAADFKIIKDPNAPPPIITVAADAELKASATEIKDEEEVEVDAGLLGKEEPKRTGYRLFRDQNQMKPGNLVYIRVQDFDRDVSNEPDEIDVTADASSGDSVRMKMRETGPHTGIFMGEVKTGHRPPDATASDHTEGNEARHAIDENKDAKSAWVGALDNRPPKWISVDLKEVLPVSRFEWDRGKGYDPKEDRAPIRYLIEGSRDKKTWFPMAFQPGNQAPRLRNATAAWNPDGTANYLYLPAAMLQGTGNTTDRWIGEEKRVDWIVDIDLGQVTEIARTILKNHDAENEVKKYALYTEKEPGRYPGQVREMDNWQLVYESKALDKPQNDAADFSVPKEPKEGQRTEPLKARYVRVLVTEIFGKFPEIGEFEVYPQVAFKAESPQEGIGSTFTFETPVETRHIRMTIEEFHNDAPAIAWMAVYDKDGKPIVPTSQKIHELATNDVLELSPGDEISITYVDEKNINPGEPKSYRSTLAATYFNGLVRAIVHDFLEDERGNRTKVDYMVRRIRPGDRFVVEIIEYDEDKTDGVDKIPFVVKTASGKTKELEARETDQYSGVFTKEVDTSADGKADTLQIADTDSLTIEYFDVENTNPGHKAPRTTTIYTTSPTEGKVKIIPNIRTAYVPTKAGAAEEELMKLVAVEQDMEIEVADPDVALNSGNKVTVKLTTTSGAEASVECRIAGGSTGYSGFREFQSVLSDALELGIFRGRIRVALGDKSSPATRVQVTGFQETEFTVGKKKKEEGPMIDLLNVMGGDTITARYVDETTPENPLATERYDSAKIISDGEFGIFDDEYEKPLEFAHAGEKLHLQVLDPDMDGSAERDPVIVKVESFFDDGSADTLEFRLMETLSHSGIFNGTVQIDHQEKPVPDNNALEANFGNTIKVTYVDKYNTKSAQEPRTLQATVQVVTGTDGEMIAFGQKFPNNALAVETQFRIGECYYFLGKEHVELKQSAMGLKELSEGQEILTDVVTHHPDSEMVDQIGYLLGNITQEQQKYDDAVVMYRRVTRDWPDSVVAADAQYKTAMCYEKKGEFDMACEEYVRLAYKYPDSPLVADSMIRIGLYYFNKKKYETALGVFGRFVEKFPDHSSAQKVGFKMGLCYILAERFSEGGDHFKKFVEKFPDSDLKAAALYWAGDSYLKANDALKSYQMFKRCIWDFADSKWAKFARGRLTAPIFDRISEME
jgi:TolA-binding protein